ncbi:hypothetical protein QLQ12_44600 [Actinoplanes sp. NEAU-A12]|uniref:HNH endonuclease n=1 Tax=Actinoplanes sandaracinus TaxID=3045177 RepID=A0ABT6X122_9ACTN|nr:hypothetical protein [Actinoplanes sandaracinus]MDI6105684.1 hypothetical protein [Actinoplanes sandaracinus]
MRGSLMDVDPLPDADAAGGVRIRADMLPPRTHGSNIRALVSAQRWDDLRRPVCDAAGRRCEICRGVSVRGGRVILPDCHEKWRFETRNGVPVQRLQRLVALCAGCHEVQHSGLAGIKGRIEFVVDRLRQLNGWSREQAEADLRRAGMRCRELDAREWALDLTVLAGRMSVAGHDGLYFTFDQRAALARLPSGH